MKLFCPECGEAIPAEKINVFALVAVCPACNHLFSFNKPDIRDNHKRKKHIQPRHLEVYENDEYVVMSYGWFKWMDIIFLAPFTFIWNSLVLSSAVTTVASGQWGGVLFMSFHIGIGLWSIYQLLCLMLNRTEISLSPDRLRVYHGPVFVSGSVGIPLHEIEHIYCKYRPHRQSRRNNFRFNPSQNCLYELHTVLLDGNDILIYGTDEEEFAQFIGQRIHHYLGLDGVLPFQDATGKSFS